MTRAQFLNSLYRRLGALSQEQAEQHLTYYAEMLADRMEEGMSEEEAVASMEDLDTIAQRILQDEGVTGIHPPRYPNLPEQPAASQPPAKPARNWRKFASIALWAAAIAIVVSVAVNRLAGRNMNQPTAVDYSSSEGLSDFSIGPDGIQVRDGETEVYIGPGGIRVSDGGTVELPEALEEVEDWLGWDSFDYPGVEYDIAADGIKKIDIEWLAGEVRISPSIDGNIQFWEYATEELTSKTQMSYRVEGSTLSIRYWEDSYKSGCSKRLELLVPVPLLEQLHVDAVSANVWVEDIQGLDRLMVDTTSGDVSLFQAGSRVLGIDTTSGGVTLAGVTATELKADTTSGDVSFSSVTADKLDASTTSGYVSGDVEAGKVEIDTTSGNVALYTAGGRNFELDTISGELYLCVESNAVSEISADSTSGDITLVLPGDMGFSLEFKTTSGALETGEYSVTRKGGKYVYGDGSCEIEVDTVSGGLTLI